jgi:tetratricopeptide (TPR) repeat protein/TolB-like protein
VLIYLFAWPALVERGAAPGAAARTAPVVAVLPFVDETGSADLAWISTGLAEMLAQNLAESPDLQVADSLRVFRTMEDLKIGAGPLPDRQLRQLADLLDVDRLVTGQVREAARRIRVDMRLVAADRPDLAARHFNIEDAATGNVFGLVQRLGDELRSALALPATDADATAPVLSAVPAALSAYTEGVAALTRGDSVGGSAALEAAVRHDDAFAAAWVRLADAYEQLGRRADALEAARRAVETVGAGPSRIGFEARAREAALSGDLAAAQAIRAELVERYPGDIEAQVALAETMGDHGHLQEAGATLEKVVATNPDHPRAWYLLGKFAILRGDSSAAAEEYLVRALVIQNKLGNAQGQGDVHNALGIAYDQLGRIEHAGREYERAIELRRAAGDQRGVAASLANLASVQRLQGNDKAARAGLEEALATLAQIGDTAAVANLHNEIGYFEEQRGAYRAALDAYRDALRLRRELGDQRAVAESYNNVGFTYYMLGEYDNASVYAGQAVDLFDATGNQEGLMNVRQTIGLLEMARGDWDAALKAYLSALETGRALGFAQAEAMSLGNLGRVAQFQGRFEAAAESYAQALALLEAAGDGRGLTEFTLFESSLLLDLGQLEAAAEGLDRAQEWLDEDPHSEQQAMLERLRGAGRLAAGDPGAARKALDRAVERAAASGSIVAQLESALGLAEIEIALDDLRSADTRLLEVRQQAGAIQHVVLQLRSAEALARAQWALGKHSEAEATVASALRLAREHEPYAGTYRLHVLMGGFLEQSGRGEQALDQWRAGAAEVARLKENLAPEAAESFGALDEVRKLAQETPLEPAA